MNNSPKYNHYGYTHYSKKDVVDDYEQDRYGSSFGRYLYDLEVENYLSLLSDDGKVLDIGTGTGKLFLALLKKKRNVTGIDSSLSMISFLKSRYKNKAFNGNLQVADALQLPFNDKSFDSVVSSRVLMHLFDWKQGIREFCRVSSNEVIMDFPPLSGFTFFIPFINKFKKLFYKNSRPYNVFSMKSIKNEFERHDFQVVSSKRLFFLPIAIHRAINNVGLSRQIENLFERIGLIKLFGGPLIIKAQRYDN